MLYFSPLSERDGIFLKIEFDFAKYLINIEMFFFATAWLLNSFGDKSSCYASIWRYRPQGHGNSHELNNLKRLGIEFVDPNSHK